MRRTRGTTILAIGWMNKNYLKNFNYKLRAPKFNVNNLQSVSLKFAKMLFISDGRV